MSQKILRCSSLANGDGFLELINFVDYIDISKVSFYEIAEVDGTTLTIKFYDSDMNLITPSSHIPNL